MGKSWERRKLWGRGKLWERGEVVGMWSVVGPCGSCENVGSCGNVAEAVNFCVCHYDIFSTVAPKIIIHLSKPAVRPRGRDDEIRSEMKFPHLSSRCTAAERKAVNQQQGWMGKCQHKGVHII